MAVERKRKGREPEPAEDSSFVSEKSKKRKRRPEMENVEKEEKGHKEPRKKKKKKADAEEEGQGEGGAGGEKKMSKRQMKREKHAQRMLEAERASHEAVRTQALAYLSLWKHNRQEWKFNKVKQIWLFKHKFDGRLPEELWEPFVEYFSSGSQGIKASLLEESQKTIQRAESTEATDKPDDTAYRRARHLIQHLNA